MFETKPMQGRYFQDHKRYAIKLNRLLVDSLFLKKNSNKPAKPPDIQKWSKPPDNHVKINFDGLTLMLAIGATSSAI